MRENKTYKLRKHANDGRLFEEMQDRVLDMRKSLRELKSSGKFSDFQMEFQEPTVHRANFKGIFDGIKFESSVQENSTTRKKQNLIPIENKKSEEEE